MIQVVNCGSASSFADLDGFVGPIHNEGLVFRGQSKDWELIPKVGRPEFCLGKGGDLREFQEWKRLATAFIELPDNDYDCLAVAQHRGLATRFVDWTQNLFAAVFFAAEKHTGEDGVVFCLQHPGYLNTSIQMQDEEDCLALYRPRLVDRRIFSQSGVFMYHGNPSWPINNYGIHNWAIVPQLFRIIIPAASKQDWLERLNYYGVNRVTLFPDLEGLSDYSNWRIKRLAAKWKTRLAAKGAA